MKILISASGPTLDSPIDPRFGRAPWLLLVDSDNGTLIEAINNQAGQDATQGAGINAAAMAADKGVQAIYTGRLGPKAAAVVNQAGIQVVEGVSGTVAELLTSLHSSSDAEKPKSPTQQEWSGQGQCRGGGRGMGGGRGGGGGGTGQCRRQNRG